MTSLLSPLAALGSAGVLGVADFGGGLASRRTPAASVVVATELIGLVAVPAGALLLPSTWAAGPIAVAFTGGAIAGVGLLLFYRAIGLTLMSIVTPITGVVAASLPCLVGIVAGERLHPWQLVGVTVGLAAIVLINGVQRGIRGRTNAGVVFAVLTGVAFGIFFILLHDASSAGVPAFVSSRVGTEAVALGAALFAGVSPVARREAWPLVAFVGVLDGIGNVLYLYASRGGLLSITALLASFYPAFTVACARVFMNERLTLVQKIGAGLALSAVALIAAA